MYTPPVRDIDCRIIIDYSAIDLDQSVEFYSDDQSNISNLSQLADGIEKMSNKFILLDGNNKLDGSYTLFYGHRGWWGNEHGDANGNLSQTLTATHTARPIEVVSLVGDSIRNEWAVDFEVKMYDSSDNLLYTHSVVGNAEFKYSDSITPVADVVKQVLKITKWSKPNTVIKISEFFTSVQDIYLRDDIFNLNILEERLIIESGVPVGSIASAECDLKIWNADRKFDAGNTASRLHGLLKPNRRVRPFMESSTVVKLRDVADKRLEEL